MEELRVGDYIEMIEWPPCCFVPRPRAIGRIVRIDKDKDRIGKCLRYFVSYLDLKNSDREPLIRYFCSPSKEEKGILEREGCHYYKGCKAKLRKLKREEILVALL